MENDISFGTWMRRMRKALDLTQAELAQKLGYSKATIRKLEAEERRPSIQIVEQLTKLFNIPPADQDDFLRFARGDITETPALTADGVPWQLPSKRRYMNLPAPATSLIGREADLTAVQEYLVRDNVRLLNLIGPPGIGKTRLSIESARILSDHFEDGVFFVGLAPLSQSDLVASEILQTLGFIEQKDCPPLDRIKDGIADKHLLLVMDNLEHIIEAAGLIISELMAACPHLKLLTTSREALRIMGEWLYPVHELKVPGERQAVGMDMKVASQFSALSLFAERARAVRPDFSLYPDNLPVVASICTRLDGLPLAIELIAARVRWMSPQSLLERLSQGFTLQADGVRHLPARQKTLNNAIAWSYDLLSEDEKILFGLLSIFSGGFKLEAAVQIFADFFTSQPAADLIFSLVDKSLLQCTFDEQGEPRFGMLATIQEYAGLRLLENGQEEAAQERHLFYCLDLAEKGSQEVHGRQQVEWINRLDVELDNFRSALDWCVKTSRVEHSLRLLKSLGWVWIVRSHYGEMRSWFERITNLPGVDKYPVLYAGVLNNLGKVSWLMGDFKHSKEIFEQAKTIWLRLGHAGEGGLAEAYDRLGMNARWGEGDNLTARKLFEQSFELYQKYGDQRGIAESLFHLAIIEDDCGNESTALEMYKRCLKQFQELGDLWGIARVSQLTGQLYLQKGQYKKASFFFNQHLEMDQSLHFIEGVVVALRNLGDLNRYQNNYQEAGRFYENSLRTCQEHDLRDDLSKNLYLLSLLALHQDDYSGAAQSFSRYYEIARRVYPKKSAADLLNGLAAVAAGIKRSEQAALIHGAAKAAMETIDLPYSPLDQAEFDRHMQIARQELGQDQFLALEKEGRQMEMDDAIDLAFEMKSASRKN
jgi:predicted ATPase/transcriptional regulator with XRE-family HTH domain